MPPPIRLSRSQTARIMLGALRNAERLLADAELLSAHGSSPRAHALAALAYEEYGKFLICFSAFELGQRVDFDWSLFSRRFRSHRDKLMQARAASLRYRHGDPLSSDDLIARLRSHAVDENVRKLRGFYADIAEDGSVLTPELAIDQQTAEELIDDVRFLLQDASGMSRSGELVLDLLIALDREPQPVTDSTVERHLRELLRARRAGPRH